MIETDNDETPQTKSVGKLGLLRAKLPNYEFSDVAENVQSSKYLNIKTAAQLFEALKNPDNKDIDVEARVICVEKGTGKAVLKKMNRSEFVEAFKSNSHKKKFTESVDYFALDEDVPSNQVGKDFTPMLGGPFSKQLYYYDYLKMHSQCFNAWNHDPILHAAVLLIRDFVIGRGFRVDCKNPKGQALWDAFAEVNNLSEQMDQFCIELCVAGEQMIWWLPQGQTAIEWQVTDKQHSAKGILPRFRLMDPSVIADIVCYPEDVNRKISYVWMAPTFYNMYTDKDKGDQVPGTKFIFQHVPADQVDHYKINCFSTEKRGRSDLFPILGYAKRLRDSVNYSIIAMQKASAWAIDTSIDGNQSDIDDYINSQEQLGTIPPPGSEFVHSKKVERKYLSNEGSAKGQQSGAFDWSLKMICAGLGIPESYLISSGQHTTRASAVVATEPVTKKFEARRLVIEKALTNMSRRLFKQFGIDAEIEVTWPELISQDRSAKMKDLAMAVSMGWISNERAAEITAKELDITNFDWEVERRTIEHEKTRGEEPNLIPGTGEPLTQPGQVPAQGPVKPDVKPADAKPDPNSAMTSKDKRDVRVSRGF